MTYQQLKTKIVDENKTMTKKEFNSFLLWFSLFIIGIASSLVTLVVATLPIRWVLLVMFMVIALFVLSVNSIAVEDAEQNIQGLKRITKIWWLPFIVLAAEIYTLHYFNFL